MRAVRIAFALLLAAAPLRAQTPPPIVVQGAMEIEVDNLAAHLTDATRETIAGWTFWRGTVDGYPVIVSKTLKGVSNAAAATTLAAERFHPLAIINQGTAGGHDPALRLYDIVLGTSALNVGAFRSPYRAAGAGSSTLDWTPIDLTAQDGTSLNSPRKPARFPGDERLLAAARSVKTSYTRGKVVEGAIGTSDVWNDELDRIARFNKEYGTLVEEMETASAAQIAGLMSIPFLGIRIVSDNTTNGGAYDPKTADACEEFVYLVVKAYVAGLKR